LNGSKKPIMEQILERDPREEAPKQTKSKTPVLDNFGRDITKLASDGLLDPIIGRENEVERMTQILSRRKKNNPILIGNPGVGKSALIEGLAMRIVARKVSRNLYDKRVITLDLAALMAGAVFRGQFEERMKAVLNEAAKNKDVILFIDELHTIMGFGGSGAMDASNMIKPALANGELQLIGATTLDEYRMHIEKDGALDRRFQRVMVDPPSAEETLTILKNLAPYYEDHHAVSYDEKSLEACVRMTDRYISDRFFPDKAIDVLDEAGARVHLQNVKAPKEIELLEKEIEQVKELKSAAVKAEKFELAGEHRSTEVKLTDEHTRLLNEWKESSKLTRFPVTEEDVAHVVAMSTGIPAKRIGQSESEKLLTMKDDICRDVVGQDEAVERLVKAIQRSRTGMKDAKKPMGAFMFLGSSGCGKTHVCKMLAKYLFDNEDLMIRIDMSEYQERCIG